MGGDWPFPYEHFVDSDQMMGGGQPFPLGRTAATLLGGDAPFPLAGGASLGGEAPFPLNASSRKVRVHGVEHVCASIVKTNPPQLMIEVTGSVNSSGWSRCELVETYHVAPPQDGIWDFDLVAEPPRGIVLWVMSRIAPSKPMLWTNGDLSSVVGIRIHAAGGATEFKLGDSCGDLEARVGPFSLARSVSETAGATSKK